MTPEMLSEHELRQLLDTALDVVVLCDAEGVFSWVSPSADSALGRPDHELTGRTTAELVHPDDVGRVLGAIHDAFASPGTVVAVEAFRFRGGDGADRWLSGRWRAVSSDQPGGLGVVAVLRDVAELVHARRVAEADRAELRATLESLLDPHLVLDPIRDDDAVVVDFFVREANPAVTAGSGTAAETLIGSRVAVTFPPRAARAPSASAPASSRPASRSCSTTSPITSSTGTSHAATTCAPPAPATP